VTLFRFQLHPTAKKASQTARQEADPQKEHRRVRAGTKLTNQPFERLDSNSDDLRDTPFYTSLVLAMQVQNLESRSVRLA